MNKNTSVQPVILCGGSGSRLWPLSRSGYPKQFLNLGGQYSLFQQSVIRLSNNYEGVAVEPPIVVTGEDHRFLVAEQLREIGCDTTNILLEPTGRNTAPALTLAAHFVSNNSEYDPILIVAPADHLIEDLSSFASTLQVAIKKAEENSVIILGVKPSKAETAYGYIHTSERIENKFFKVNKFVEKPSKEIAEEYLAQGDFYWNAGLFVLKASMWLRLIEQFRSDIATTTKVAWDSVIEESLGNIKFVRPDKDKFCNIPSESIDYAVIEKCPDSIYPIYMIPLETEWNDLGAWNAVWECSEKDVDGNAFIGDCIVDGSKNNFVYATSRLVSLVNVSDLIVVETEDAILVADKQSCQHVKNIVQKLNDEKRTEVAFHRKVYRPWGWYDDVDRGYRFKVRRIKVKPGESLSLQKHYHRSEHWIVVQGTAEIWCENKKLLLTENQSTYIELGQVHKLFNPGLIPLELIEVQTGSYLSENDIVRI